MQSSKISSNKNSIFGQLGILLALFLLAFILVSVLQSVLNQLNLTDRAELLICSGAQALLVFALPPIIEAYYESNKPFAVLGANKKISLKNILGICLIYLLGFPFLNQCIFYNEHLHFPETWNSIENILRKWEDTNAQITNIILSGRSLMDLIIGVLVVGVITGISEELFFRAGLQRIFGLILPTQMSIWITAVIFSTMHFQFFGFFPRVLLGAYFGYLYFWTGSIWSSAIAHALNNSLVVIANWLIINNYLDKDFDSWGITESGFPYIAVLSGFITILILIKCNRQLFRPIQKKR